MKTIKLLGFAAIMFAYSCSTTQQAGNATDDVYYSSKSQPVQQSSAPSYSGSSGDYNNGSYSGNDYNSGSGQSQQSDYSNNQNSYSTERYSDNNGNTYITNNYYDDYYDYEYSSRIRRFYTPAYGYGYYDPFYTNSYWYDYRPSSWGVSIYLGYNWWAPSYYYYQPFCYGGYGWSFGIGYGSYWGYPHYGYYGYPGYGHNFGYLHGYNHGYHHGYYDGYYSGNYNPYYYNSYDANSYHYGPRGSSSSNSQRATAQRDAGLMPIGSKYERAVAQGKVTDSRDEVIRQENRSGRQNTDRENVTPQNNSRNNPVNSGREQARPQENNETRTQPANSRDSRTQPQNNSDIRTQPDNSRDSRTQPQNSNDSRTQPATRPSVNPRERGNSDLPSGMPSPSRNQPDNNSRQENNRNNQMQRSNPVPDNSGERVPNERSFERQTPNPGNTRPDIRSNDNNVSPREVPQRNQFEKRNAPSPRIDQSPKQEEYRDIKTDDFKAPRQESIRETPSRQENKAPVFSPRNEPRQYKQESTPTPRSQPSRSGENRRGGRGN